MHSCTCSGLLGLAKQVFVFCNVTEIKCEIMLEKRGIGTRAKKRMAHHHMRPGGDMAA